MARPLCFLALALACLAASCATTAASPAIGHLQDNLVIERFDDEIEAAVAEAAAAPRVVMAGDVIGAVPRGWGWTTPPSYRTSSRRYSTSTPRYKTTTSGKDQSVTIGGVYPYDRQLVQRTVFKAASLWVVNTESLSVSTGGPTIHCIQIVDLQKNGQNADVTVQRGGVGQRDVTIKFKSQRGGKINYLAIIWGQ